MALRRRGAQERLGDAVDLLVIGLGNPGKEYEGTRHNVGAMAIERLAEHYRVSLKVEPRQRASLAVVTMDGKRVALSIPTTYMNESGAALPGLLKRCGLNEASKILVIHDELDLEAGRLQLKVGGGIAGHNGLRSIKAVVNSAEFLRLRIGVGRPPSREAGASWVLSKARGADATFIDEAITRAGEAVEIVAAHGVERAMTQVNARG
jgi:peptidyl-tRNA hydrolase, PTH1 family